MTDIITDASPRWLTEADVFDTNYTVPAFSGVCVSYQALTAARSVFLPASVTPGQLVQVMDETGNCSSTNTITVAPNGTDTIEGVSVFILEYAYASLEIEATGTGKWIVITNPNPALSVGVKLAPTYTDLGTGSITVGTGLYNLHMTTEGIGKIKTFQIPGGTFTLTDGVRNYVVADYNGGSPLIKVVTDVNLINETTVTILYGIYREGTILHLLNWDQLGDALVNKIHQSIVLTQRYRAEPGGLLLGEAATRLVTVTSGRVWTGAVPTSISSYNSSTTRLSFVRHVAGVWTYTDVTQYNNTNYDDGTNVQTLPGGKFAVNFVYRGIGSPGECFFVLGQGPYSLGDAQLSQPPPNLPSLITSHCILVGRIIVASGASTATQIDSAFVTTFTGGAVTDHNSLSGIQGGSASQYYHLTSAEYTGTGTGNFVRASGPSVATPTFTTSATFPFLTSGRVPFAGTGGSITDNANMTYTVGTGFKISDATASTSTTTGAVIVTGGLGLGGSLVMGGSLGIGINPATPFHMYDTTTDGNGARFQNSTAVGTLKYGTIFQAGSNGYGISGWANSLVVEGTADGGLVLGSYANSIKLQTNRVTRVTIAVTTGQVSIIPAIASTSPTTGSVINAGGLGCSGTIFTGGYYGCTVGAAVASATTISPTGAIFHVTGTTAIATINLPFTGFTGTITIIPDGIFTTTTAGNIALASTAVVGRTLTMTYDSGTSKWYPSY